MADKGYGFIVRKTGGDKSVAVLAKPLETQLTTTHYSARFFEKQCNGMVPEKDMCVSYILEESEKGPSAKDVREEDPDRVARVTAKVHYGKVAVRTHQPTIEMWW